MSKTYLWLLSILYCSLLDAGLCMSTRLADAENEIYDLKVLTKNLSEKIGQLEQELSNLKNSQVKKEELLELKKTLDLIQKAGLKQNELNETIQGFESFKEVIRKNSGKNLTPTLEQPRTTDQIRDLEKIEK